MRGQRPTHIRGIGTRHKVPGTGTLPTSPWEAVFNNCKLHCKMYPSLYQVMFPGADGALQYLQKDFTREHNRIPDTPYLVPITALAGEC